MKVFLSRSGIVFLTHFFLQMLNTGIELFNTKPSKGIEYLQKSHIINETLVTSEIIRFLRENHGLDKAMIADYLANRKNVEILPAYVK